MHIVIQTQYYPPEIGAPQIRLVEMTQRFVQSGHRVTVLTAMPNYPTGQIQPGYGGICRHEQRDGAKILRTFIYPTQKADPLHRLCNYFSFVLSSMIFGAFLPKPDYWFVQSPPLFLGISGWWLSRLKNTKLIFNVSDLWPESAVQVGMLRRGSMTHRYSEKLEKFLYEQAWLISGQSKTILADIEARFPGRPTYHLSNGVDPSRFGPHFATREARQRLSNGKDESKPIALYAGLHGLAQGLDQVLEAAKLLQSSDESHFVLMGDGPQKADLQQQSANLQLQNLTFLPSCSTPEVPPMLASADIILVTLKSYIPGAVPSKLYEAMASGRPVILVASGEAAQIVEDNNAGLVVEPGDIAGLAAAVKKLSQDADLRQRMGENGRIAAQLHFNRDTIAARFTGFLEKHLQDEAKGVA